MCGCALAALGAGILIGSYLKTGIFCFLVGVGLIAGGLWYVCKK